MIRVSSRPYEDNMALTAPVPEQLLEAFRVAGDTCVFGLCLTAVYGISVLITIMITSRLPAHQRTNANAFAPLILTTPFWSGVLILSSMSFPGPWSSSFHSPFLEAIFWSLVAWTVVITTLTIIATLVCLTCFPDSGRRDSIRLGDFADEDLKAVEEASPLTFGEALAATSPPQGPVTPQRPQTPRTPDTPFGPRPDSRPRMGSVTRCWHEPQQSDMRFDWRAF